MILSFVFVFFLVPETKGIPLESMDDLFGIKPIWRAHAAILSRLREEEAQFRHDVEESGMAAAKLDAEQVEHAAPEQTKYA